MSSYLLLTIYNTHKQYVRVREYLGVKGVNLA